VILFLYLALLAGSFVGVFAGVAIVLRGFTRYRQAVTITDTPLSTADSIAVGPAAITGTVVPVDEPLSLPVKGGQCVAYDLSVSDDGYGSARRPLDERRATAFALDTDRGRITVTPDAVEAATLDLSARRQHECTVGSYEEPPELIATFQQRRALPDQNRQYDRTFDLEWIEPGDELYAYGRIDVDEAAIGAAGDRNPVVRCDDSVTPFLSDKSPEQLLRERRFAVGWSLCKGVVIATGSLAVFLWLSGIGGLLFGA